jgi:hypothetical protein
MENMAAQAETHDLQYPDKPTGRATTYTPATAELIAARLADGETLSSICRTPGMPSRQTVHQWRMRIPALIADDDSGDLLQDGSPNSANVQRARLQVDTRKFLLAKLAPKVYGDRVEVEHSGTVEHRHEMSDRERMRRLATFLALDARAGTLIEGQASAVDPASASPASPDLEGTAASPGARPDEPSARSDEL